eukprot:COSAG01_NODE_545_length_15679_cov_68.030167_12_plen_104_part_00
MTGGTGRGRCKCQARREGGQSRDPVPPRGQGGRVDPWDNPGAVRADALASPPLFMVLSPVNPPSLPEPPLGPTCRPPTHVHAPHPPGPYTLHSTSSSSELVPS